MAAFNGLEKKKRKKEKFSEIKQHSELTVVEHKYFIYVTHAGTWLFWNEINGKWTGPRIGLNPVFKLTSRLSWLTTFFKTGPITLGILKILLP